MRGVAFVSSFAWAAIAVFAWGSPARAQDSSAYYTVRHPDEFAIDWKAFYDRADRMTAAARRALPHTLHLAYGDAPKQKLDVYRPAGKPEGAPVLVFLHGGGFREGDRAHYGYVAVPLAEHGIVTVVPSYRLTPEARFPDQPEDVTAVLAWVARNIRAYGGDPTRVYLAGHSAGAILTATICVDPGWTEGAGDLVLRGCIPISGSYDMRTLQGAPGYVGSASDAKMASAVLNVKPNPPPAVVAVGSVEERYLAPSRALVDALREKGGRADVLVLERQAHDDTAAALGDGQGALVQAIVKLIRETRPPTLEGVWGYRTLQRAGGPEVPVTGVIAFIRGYFVQQSLNAGEPFDRQLFQAHAGTYEIAGEEVRIASTVGLLIDPSGERVVQSRRDAEHRVRVERSDENLTLTFATGTIQRFTASPLPAPEIVVLSRGILLLGGDGRFSLTAEREGAAAAGWGRYRREGERLILHADRWLRLDRSHPAYSKDREIRAALNARSLMLPDGLSFAIERRLSGTPYRRAGNSAGVRGRNLNQADLRKGNDLSGGRYLQSNERE